MKIDLFTDGNISLPFKGINIKTIKSHIKNICKYLKVQNAALTIIICDNYLIKGINKKYRNKNNPTDVIAFSYGEFPFPNIKMKSKPIGDIYISLEKALENAESYGIHPIEEIKRLIAHGILHVIGYDHEKSEEDERIMEEKEEEILKSI